MTPATAHALANSLVLVHLLFVAFVAAGGLFALRWPKVAWAHIPCFVWGAAIEIGGWVCPLTPLENQLRGVAGLDAYGEGFIDRYVLPVLYPDWLDRPSQWALAAALIAGNALVYGLVWHRYRQRRRLPRVSPGGQSNGGST